MEPQPATSRSAMSSQPNGSAESNIEQGISNVEVKKILISQLTDELGAIL